MPLNISKLRLALPCPWRWGYVFGGNGVGVLVIKVFGVFMFLVRSVYGVFPFEN